MIINSELQTENKKFKFKRLSLASKFNLSYFVIFAIPVIIFANIFYFSVKNATQSEEKSRSYQDIQQIQNDIRKNIATYKRVVNTILSDTIFMRIICNGYNVRTEELINFNKNSFSYMVNMVNINTDIYRMRVYINDHYVPEMWPLIYYESNNCEQSLIDRVKNSESNNYWRINYMEESFAGKNESKEMVSLYYDIRYPFNKHSGFIEVSMFPEVFFGSIYSLNNSNNCFIIIQDKEEASLGENSILLKNMSLDTKEIKKKLISSTTGKKGNFILELDNKPMEVVFGYNDEISSYIYKITSINMITDQLDKIRRNTIVGCILIIIVLSIITHYVTYILLGKIRNIIDLMRKVQDGEMFVNIPIQGNDEISELAYHFQKMLNKINELIYTVLRKQVATKDAEIKALHSQINAHFVYNVLESIKMRALIDYKYEISDSLTTLGSLMRYNIDWKHQYVLLGVEIKQITNYIMLIKMRYNKIYLIIDIDEELLKQRVLKMMIQPIVENAVKHGLEPKGNSGIICISGFVQNNVLNISITDDGVGISLERLQSIMNCLKSNYVEEYEPSEGYGIGLANVNERIQLFYGKDFGINVISEENVFTRVQMRLPYLIKE